jgi:hypothetical protein
LILAANKQFEWARQGTGGFVHDEPKYEPDNGPLSEQQIEQIQASVDPPKDPPQHHPDTHPYLTQGFQYPESWMFSKPMVAKISNDDAAMNIVAETPSSPVFVDMPNFDQEEIGALDTNINESEKTAIKTWKAANPDDTIKAQRVKLARGQIDHLPWQEPSATTHAFGAEFPDQPNKGDTYLKVDTIPSRLYKYNGKSWIHIDKDLSDNYTYDTAYIDYLIAKIDSGEYDPELLSDLEQEQIAIRLNPEIKT